MQVKKVVSATAVVFSLTSSGAMATVAVSSVPGAGAAKNSSGSDYRE